jgi:plasmid stability protein
MDMKDVLNRVREDLRERPDSHFSEIYIRTVKHGASGTEVREALAEILKRDEVRINDGKWRLIAPVERRRSA